MRRLNCSSLGAEEEGRLLYVDHKMQISIKSEMTCKAFCFELSPTLQLEKAAGPALSLLLPQIRSHN